MIQQVALILPAQQAAPGLIRGVRGPTGPTIPGAAPEGAMAMSHATDPTPNPVGTGQTPNILPAHPGSGAGKALRGTP